MVIFGTQIRNSMFSRIFKSKKEKQIKSKKQKEPAFTCKECGFTCNECEMAPLCYACHSGRDTFCPNCKCKVRVKDSNSK